MMYEVTFMRSDNLIEDNEINMKEILASLWFHKFFIFFVTTFFVFVSAFYVLNADKIYTASATFEIGQDRSDGLNLVGQAEVFASLAGLNTMGTNDSDLLLERILSREFILSSNTDFSLSDDTYFNNYDPAARDPLWKATIKKLIGWKPRQLSPNQIVIENVVKNFRRSIKAKVSKGGAISISVTHSNPFKAAEYANAIVNKIKQLVEFENATASEKRLNYLSETLADALQEVEVTQQNLKDFTLKNNALAQESFISGSLRLDDLRVEFREAEQFFQLLDYLKKIALENNLTDTSYQNLRLEYPLVDDVRFRRILGMSETISAWSWPDINTLDAVTATLFDRIQRLRIEISEMENEAKAFAKSAEDLNRLKREAKIAEATYTVLIEQVKSQSLAAGFKPDTFKIFEYAAPPLGPSAPKRNTSLGLGLVLGLFSGCFLSIVNANRRNVFYSNGQLINKSNCDLALKSKNIRKLSGFSVNKLIDKLTNKNLIELDEASVSFSETQIFIVLSSYGRLKASDLARVIAAHGAISGKKVVICDTTGETQRVNEEQETKQLSNMSILPTGSNVDILKENTNESGYLYFTSADFKSNVKKLSSSYDKIIFCTDEIEAITGLKALETFNPCVVLVARKRKTKKRFLERVQSITPIGILCYG